MFLFSSNVYSGIQITNVIKTNEISDDNESIDNVLERLNKANGEIWTSYFLKIKNTF